MALEQDENEQLWLDGDSAWETGDLDRAFTLFRQGARNGDTSCQNNLGVFYECGYGTKKNLHKAMYWYRKSARDDNSCAIHNIADLYKKMNNMGMARHWFERAIRLVPEDGDTCLELAQLFMNTGRPTKRRIRDLLKRARDSKFVTPYGREEAERLLRGR